MKGNITRPIAWSVNIGAGGLIFRGNGRKEIRIFRTKLWPTASTRAHKNKVLMYWPYSPYWHRYHALWGLHNLPVLVPPKRPPLLTVELPKRPPAKKYKVNVRIAKNLSDKLTSMFLLEVDIFLMLDNICRAVLCQYFKLERVQQIQEINWAVLLVPPPKVVPAPKAGFCAPKAEVCPNMPVVVPAAPNVGAVLAAPKAGAVEPKALWPNILPRAVHNCDRDMDTFWKDNQQISCECKGLGFFYNFSFLLLFESWHLALLNSRQDQIRLKW
jgi:hypothetical protein